MLKLNAAGTLKYSTCYGGLNSDEARGLSVDAAGTAYVVGWTNSGSLPQKRNAGVQTAKAAEESGWVMKVSAQTATTPPRVKFSTYLGGNDTTQTTNVLVKSPYVYVAGTTRATNMDSLWPDAAAGAYQTNAGNDAFVVRLRFDSADPHAPIVDRFTHLGGTSNEPTVGRMVVRGGSVWLTGETGSADFPTVDPLAGTACAPTGQFGQPPSDVYVARLNTTLTALTFSTCVGVSPGVDNEGGRGIAVDAAGNAHVTGYTREAGFPTTPGAFDGTYNGSADAFVAKISPGP